VLGAEISDGMACHVLGDKGHLSLVNLDCRVQQGT
jgi:hypothetical protein